jgi:DNA-binding transcriptional LysR family regulator
MRPALELRHLWYFVAVAELGSFTRAAARVGIAQPPLSQQIQQLERIVGCALFDRAGRRVQLTAAGQVLLADARRILAEAEEATALLRRMASGEVGTLTIGFAPSTLLSPLPAAVRRYRERFPSVRLRLQQLATPDHAEALRAGRVDVVVVREPEEEPGLRIVPVFRERFVAAVPADHPLARRRVIAVAALAAEPFILFPPAVAPGLYRQILALCRGDGFEPNVVQEADEWHTIVSLVETGLGVSLIPASFEHQRSEALACLALRGRQRHTTTAALVRADGGSPAARAFLEMLGRPAPTAR